MTDDLSPEFSSDDDELELEASAASRIFHAAPCHNARELGVSILNILDRALHTKSCRFANDTNSLLSLSTTKLD